MQEAVARRFLGAGSSNSLGEILFDQVCQSFHVLHSGKAFPKHQNDESPDSGAGEFPVANHFIQFIVMSRVPVGNREGWHERVAQIGCHELTDRLETRGMKLLDHAPMARGAGFDDLIPKAVAVFEKNHFFGFQIADLQTGFFAQGMSRRKGEKERLKIEGNPVELGVFKSGGGKSPALW